MKRSLAVAIGALIVAGGSAALLVVDDPPWRSDGAPSPPFQLPEALPGTEAAYTVSGEYETLLGPAMTGNESEFGGAASLTVRISLAPLPDRTGETLGATVIQLYRGDELVTAAAGHDGVPIEDVELVARSDPNNPFPPLSYLVFPGLPGGEGGYHPLLDRPTDAGFADTLLLAGREIPRIKAPLTNVSPVVEVLAGTEPHVLNDELANLTIKASSAARSDFVVEIHDGERTQTTYRYASSCPLPERVTYTDANGGVGFEAVLTQCKPGEEPTARPTEQAPSRAWPEPEKGTFDRTFPGRGANLPLAYRGALEFFLSQPETRTFTQQNPDWVLTCATAHRRGEHPALHEWTWRFDIGQGSATHTGWVTRSQSPAGMPDQWTKDPDPPGVAQDSLCQSQNPPPPPARDLQGTEVVKVDTTYPIYERLIDEATMREDAWLDSITLGPQWIKYSLSRCGPYLEEQGGGFCSEFGPFLLMGTDGDVIAAAVEPGWAGEALSPLFEDATEPR